MSLCQCWYSPQVRVPSRIFAYVIQNALWWIHKCLNLSMPANMIQWFHLFSSSWRTCWWGHRQTDININKISSNMKLFKNTYTHIVLSTGIGIKTIPKHQNIPLAINILFSFSGTTSSLMHYLPKKHTNIFMLILKRLGIFMYLERFTIIVNKKCPQHHGQKEGSQSDTRDLRRHWWVAM